MTIAFPLVGDTLGGAQRSTIELAKALSERKEAEVHLVLHQDNEQVRRKLAGSSVQVSLLPSQNFLGPPRFAFRSRWRAGLDVLRVALWCRMQKVDMVHTNDRRCHRIWGQGGTLGKTKWILHRRKMGNPPFAPKLLRKADHVITISESCRDSITRIPADRLTCIYNAIEVPESYRRSRVFGDDGTVRLLFLGNVIARKRFNLYVQMASKLCERDSGRYQFHFAGRDSSGLAEAELCALSEEARRRFVVHGEVSDPWPLLAKADILVAPAVDEAFGRTLVEAQLAGVVVIASRDSGHREIVEHGVTGFLAAPDDVNGFTQWVEYVSDLDRSQEIRDLCDSATTQARKRFSVDRLAGEVFGIYKSAVSWQKSGE